VAGGQLSAEFDMVRNWFYLGLDLGQRRDYSAIAVVDRVEPPAVSLNYVAWLQGELPMEPEFVVRHLERVPLGSSYVSVVKRIVEMTRSPELRGRCTVVADGTGVGRAVMDLLRDSEMNCELVAAQITGGARVHGVGGSWNVPKRDLISVLQVLLDQRRLIFAEGLPRMRTLVDELMAMEARMTAQGNEQFAARREGSHDDLALALALACWRAVKG
jgi:hypothetical protein